MKNPINKKQIQLIHIAKQQLNIDDDLYRDILQNNFNVSSSKELTNIQAEQLLRFFRSKGFRIAKPARNKANGMGLDTTGLAYSMAKAQETARMNASMQGIMAKKYMPIAKGYLTVIFVAVIPLIIIIALVTSNFQKPFAMIFGLLIALALWNVGDQLLDFIIIVRTKVLFALSGMNGYNMESQPFINSVITDTLSLSLGMYWMIPTLAFSIATLSGYGAASMMGSIAGTATAGVSSAAAEAASGSMSAGNIRMNNVNMNKYDAA